MVQQLFAIVYQVSATRRTLMSLNLAHSLIPYYSESQQISVNKKIKRPRNTLDQGHYTIPVENLFMHKNREFHIERLTVDNAREVYIMDIYTNYCMPTFLCAEKSSGAR